MTTQNLNRSPGNSQGVSQQLKQLAVCTVLEWRCGQAYLESLIPAANDRLVTASGLNSNSKAGLPIFLENREHAQYLLAPRHCLCPGLCPDPIFWFDQDWFDQDWFDQDAYSDHTLGPNMAVPTRIRVAPSSMAIA